MGPVLQVHLNRWVNEYEINSNIADVLLAHKIIESGKPNRFGCRIALCTNWNLTLLDMLLADYDDREVVEWLKFGFMISQDDNIEDPIPADTNHKGATMYPEVIENYIDTELRLGATMGPFTIPPFIDRIGISPLSTRPKKESAKRRIIMDLSFPMGRSVNDGIDKNTYNGEQIRLTYPSIDTLAQRIAQLGPGCLIWKKDLLCYFRQVPVCLRDFR